MSKRVKYWNKCRAKLKIEFEEKGITRCEICGSDFGLSFHHRHKRTFYYDKPELLGDFDQTLLLCANCHPQLETDKELTNYYFKKLRDEIKSDNKR